MGFYLVAVALQQDNAQINITTQTMKEYCVIVYTVEKKIKLSLLQVVGLLS
jgi:energy-converting hydrogenase Eha subunit H